MNRYIKLANDKGRDAEIILKPNPPSNLVTLGLPNNQKTTTKKVIKASSKNTFEALAQKANKKPEVGVDFDLQVANAVGDMIINDDVEIDYNVAGKYISEVSRVYINESLKPVFSVDKTEKIFAANGEMRETRSPKYLLSNITGDSIVKWSGKLFPKAKVFNKLVFEKKYQIKHVNGLTYDFLFQMAKELNDKNALMMVGAGTSGSEPIVLTDGGNPYRGFLEGRVLGEKYCLLLHLSDQELKPLPNEI